MGKGNMGGCQGKESNVWVVPDHDKPISEKTMDVKKEEKQSVDDGLKQKGGNVER